MIDRSSHNRRDFLKSAGAMAAASCLPLSMVELAFADQEKNFTFAYISDSHIQHIKGTEFVRNWDRGLIRAVAETNLLDPKPDFVVFGGDLAQLGTKAELDHGAEMLAKLDYKTYCVMGEHDYYLDLGEYWSKLFGDHYYSWDHKGVHFVVLNSILTYDEWTFDRWPTAEQRMLEMAGLDNPNGSPFMVGEKQREWLAQGPGEGEEGHAGRGLLPLAHPEDLQGLEFLDRGRRRGAGAAQALRRCHRRLRARAPDPVQPDRQHQFPRRDGHGLALALPGELRPGREPHAQADRADEPRRSVLRARRHRLADHRHGQRPRRP